MITVDQIRQHLLNLLDSNDTESKTTLDEFDDWFAGASWNMHQGSDLIARKFAAAIELRLAEYDSGHLDEVELRRELVQLLKDYSVNFSLEPVTVVNSSNSTFSSRPWAFASVGSPLVTACE